MKVHAASSTITLLALLYEVAMLSGSPLAVPNPEVSITFDEFSNAITLNGYPTPSRTMYEGFVRGMAVGNIGSKMEAAMALTQFIHESNGFQWKSEPACDLTGCPGQYEDSSCDISPNSYYGRGYIQLTWCTNYKNASEDLGLGNLLVEHPELVALSEDLRWATAFWYWGQIIHDADGIQEGQFGVSTKFLNDNECIIVEDDDDDPDSIFKNRFKTYSVIFKIFGIPGHPDPTGC